MRPTRRALAVLAAWTLLGFLCAAWPGLVSAWAAAGAAIAAWLTIDAVRLYRVPLPEVARLLPRSLPLGAWTTVGLRLTATGSRPVRLAVFDEHPVPCQARDLPARLELAPGSAIDLRYALRPIERGLQEFGGTALLVDAPGGAWRRSVTAGAPQRLRVYPNFAAVSEYALLAAAGRTGQIGVRRYNRRGEGLELFQLREYRDGDTIRQIDWKATARRQQPIAREYQDESSQQVLFLLDCGRRMRAKDGELSHLDHALDALLLLAFVALRGADAVGVQTFGGTERALAPQRGRAAMKNVLNLVHDLEPTLDAPDYLELARSVIRSARRRALVVLITNVRDEDAEDLEAALELLRRRHLVVLASLRESALDIAAHQDVRRFEDAIRAGSAQVYLEARRRAHERIAASHVAVLDVEPQRLPVALVNRYLEIKSRGAL